MRFNIVAISIIAFCITGCTRTLELSVTCNPAGATIHDRHGNNLGICPTTAEYEITKLDRQNGYMNLNGLTAVWPSGASASVSSIHADLQLGTTQHFGFQRPTDVPGYDMDATNAQKVEEQAQAKREANANLLLQGLAQGAVMAAGARGGGTAGLNAETSYLRGQNQSGY